MAAATVKHEKEVCVLCNSAVSDLYLPEEYDAGAPSTLPRMKSILLHLSHNKPLPVGRICGNCAKRAVDAYNFSTQISSTTTQPLSEKIRDLRKRLHQLTQRIDVFIVVGAGSEEGYQEDDIIMVQKDKLAAAVAADEQRTTKWLREDYQCSICPMSFKSERQLSSHVGAHAQAAVARAHVCWRCGARAGSPAALHAHSRTHCARPLTCHLCAQDFESETSLSAHGASCPPVCPACGAACLTRADLSAHAREIHARGPPALCEHCFYLAHTEEERLAHSVQHRAGTHYMCGADGCLLRFKERSSLKEHVRRAHGAAWRTPAATRAHTHAHAPPSIGTRSTRTRARNQVCNEPESASECDKAVAGPARYEDTSPEDQAASPQDQATSPERQDEDDVENVEYLDMETFDDD